ncbi:MAG: cysteine synthase A [Clostridia bacterium]|nr:cysteine synthase A [Clostridia bacterium]
MKVYNSITQLVGRTSLFESVKLQREENLKAHILFKLEYFNPTGSAKDRAALFMLSDAEQKGLIKEGATIIEPTSGNTGIGLAAIGVSKGYKVVLTMPDTMSEERRALLKAYGATLVLTDGKLGMQGAIDKANEINKLTPNSFIPSQFDNTQNPCAHYQTTGPEIYEDTDGLVDVLVAGIGTGGTLSGTGKFLKEKKPNVFVVGVEPESSPLISKGLVGKHKLQGIGANFIPENFDKTVCDKVLTASDEKAYYWANRFAKTEGLLVGISSGAVIDVAVELAKKEENAGKTIVAILVDSGNKYLSSGLYD